MRRSLLYFVLVAVFFTAGCKTIQYVPIEHTEYVHIKDSVYFRDTTVQYQIEKEYIEKYAQDTLRLETAYSNFVAFTDTTVGKLSGKAWNKSKTVEIPAQFKEKIVYKDSLVYQDKPVPVEVEKVVKVVPWYAKILSGLGILFLVLSALWAGKKFL